jgi:hypothetical protein
MTRLVRIAPLLLVLGCKGDDEPEPEKLLDTGWFTDTAAVATNPDTCPHRFVSTFPAGGESRWYYRDRPSAFVATSNAEAYEAWLVDGGGLRLDSEMVWREGNVAFDLVWDGLLEADTDYTLWTKDCATTESITFHTSPLGAPIDGGANSLVGKTWRLDLVGATWVEPGALAGLLAVYFSTPILLGVQYADSANIDFIGAPGYVDGLGRIRQDTAPTWDFPVQSFDQSPYFEAEVASIDLEYYDGANSVTIPVQDFRLYATFAPDGESLGGARLSGRADTRGMGELLGSDEPNTVCDFAVTLGVQCVPCADGMPYCLYLEAEDLDANLVDDVTIVPR